MDIILLFLSMLLPSQSSSQKIGTIEKDRNLKVESTTISQHLKKRYTTKTIYASKIAPGYNHLNATACFTNAIKSANSGDTVVIDHVKGTNGVWFIAGRHPNWFDGKKGRDRVADNLTIIFEKGVTLRAIDRTYDDESGLDMLFRLENISGWKIMGYGARFEMDKDALPEGEYRNAIALYDCKDIVIEGLTVDGSGGDGIYIGSRHPEGFSENITLNNMVFKNHRRQGMSVLSGQNILVKNVKFNGSLGRKPMSGLDFEGGARHRFVNIMFKNVEFAHNGYTGILFALSKLNNRSVPLDVKFEGVYIFDNWKEPGILDAKYKKAALVLGMGGGASTAVQGSITFNSILIKNEKFDGIFTLRHHDSYKLVFNDLVIENVGTANALNAQTAIHTSRFNYNSPTPAVGNIDFNGLLIRENRYVPFWQLEGDSNDGWSIDNVTIANALVISPYTQTKGIKNTTNARKGPGTVMQYRTANAIPKTILNIKRNNTNIVRGSIGSFTITRTASELDFPLPVEYTISGTADNMDDYDLLHGYVIIPAKSHSVEIPIHARAKKDNDETLTITMVHNQDYILGNSTSQTINIIAK